MNKQVEKTSFLGKTNKILSFIRTLVGGFVITKKIGAFKEPPRDKLPKYIQIFCRKMAGSFNIEVVEVKPVPKTHALWVSNHVSWMDIPVVGSVSPVFFLSKAEIGDWPIFGRLVRAAGTLFIKRGSGETNSISDQIADFLRGGSSVIFFPEATTTRGHKMKRIHGKLLKAAIDTELPIQPIVICYADVDGNISETLSYYGKMSMKDSLKKILNVNHVTAYVMPLEPLYPEDKTQKELTTILGERMQTGLATLQQKVLKNKPEEASWNEVENNA